jgi:hypothetical protein
LVTLTLTDLSADEYGCFCIWLIGIFCQHGFSCLTMTETQMAVEEDLMVDLTFHDFSAGLIKDFASRIVKPYFKGNLNQAIKLLMEKALTEETMFNQTIRQ